MKCLPLFPVLCCWMLSAAFSPGQTDPNPAKTRALELRDLLTSSFAEDRHPSQEAWDDLRKKIDDYQKEFGVTEATGNNVFLLRKQELACARKFPDPENYRTLLRQLAGDPLPRVSELAKQQLAVLDRLDALKTKPIELQFIAIDRTPVDLARMRGKVVMIYFWAAEDPDCLEVNEDIVNLHKKYHPRGFEIVGISLDENRDTLSDFIDKNDMPWPQYFDARKWDNVISRSFAINFIPTLWLIDKKGMVTLTTHKPGDVESALGRLLPP